MNEAQVSLAAHQMLHSQKFLKMQDTQRSVSEVTWVTLVACNSDIETGAGNCVDTGEADCTYSAVATGEETCNALCWAGAGVKKWWAKHWGVLDRRRCWRWGGGHWGVLCRRRHGMSKAWVLVGILGVSLVEDTFLYDISWVLALIGDIHQFRGGIAPITNGLKPFKTSNLFSTVSKHPGRSLFA